MSDRLKDQLTRLGETTPELTLPPDLWRRGRRAYRRTQAMLVLAMITVLAGSLAGFGLLWDSARVPSPADLVPPDRAPTVAAPAATTLGVPNRIYAVPWRAGDRLQKDLAVGRTAVAFVTRSGIPVVVDAADGSYSPLQLPGMTPGDAIDRAELTDANWLALSPDGRKLAYGGAGNPFEGGYEVRVVDLMSGQVTTIDLPNPRTEVRAVSWSPNSQWLVGFSPRSRGSVSSVTLDLPAVRVNVGEARADRIPVKAHDRALAVTDDGVVVILAGTELRTWTPEKQEAIPTPVRVVFGTTAAISSAGELAVGSSPVRFSYDYTTPRVFALDGEAREGFTLPKESPSGRTLFYRPLGWLDQTRALFLASTDERGQPEVVVASRSNGYPKAQPPRVMRVDDRQLASFTIATDLMSDGALTVERAEPDWPTSALFRLELIALAAGAGALGLRWAVTRRRRLSSWRMPSRRRRGPPDKADLPQTHTRR